MSDNLSQALNPPPHAAEPPVSDKPYPYVAEGSERLYDTIRTLQKSETGRQLLADAEKYGTTLALRSLKGSHGSFTDDERLIFPVDFRGIPLIRRLLRLTSCHRPPPQNRSLSAIYAFKSSNVGQEAFETL